MVQTSDKQTEIDFQMNANELYPIVKSAIIVGICGETGLVTSFIEHAIRLRFVFIYQWRAKRDPYCKIIRKGSEVKRWKHFY